MQKYRKEENSTFDFFKFKRWCLKCFSRESETMLAFSCLRGIVFSTSDDRIILEERNKLRERERERRESIVRFKTRLHFLNCNISSNLNYELKLHLYRKQITLFFIRPKYLYHFFSFLLCDTPPTIVTF